MKVVIIRRTTLVLVLCLLVVVSAFGINYGGLNLGSVYFNTKIKKLPIYSVQTDENKIAISFDAAWGADKTREIMALCNDYDVKATFFLVGFWVEEYPDMVREIYNNGFEIGLHSNTHPDFTKLTRAEMELELETNIKLIEDITGVRPKLFRPPYGYYNDTLIELCKQMDLSCIQWSVDSLDWKGLSGSQIAGRVTKAKPGDIVLCHNNADNILVGLKMVLEYFKTNSLKLVPVGELIYYDNYTINNFGTQIKN